MGALEITLLSVLYGAIAIAFAIRMGVRTAWNAKINEHRKYRSLYPKFPTHVSDGDVFGYSMLWALVTWAWPAMLPFIAARRYLLEPPKEIKALLEANK